MGLCGQGSTHLIIIKRPISLSTMAASDAPPVEEAAAPKAKTQPHLMPQDAKNVDPTKLTALTPEVVS
jgi:hypothetical protein